MDSGVEPVEGRKHIDIQTDNYEELTDRRPEVNEETQTEAFMDRPPLPSLSRPKRVWTRNPSGG